MKKKEVLIFLGIVLLIVFVSCGVVFLNKKFENKSVKENKTPEQESSQAKGNVYYELEDRYIYTHGLNSIKFTYNNKTKELKEWFKRDKNFLDKFIKELELSQSANDGGTNIYLDGGTKSFNLEDIVVIVCKKIDNDGYNNNIHIGKNLKYENDVCHKERKNIKNGNVNELNNINNQIINYFQANGVKNYENFAFNYVDEENKVVVVGLINNSKEEQEKFKRNIVDSKLIKFIKGERSENHNNSFKLIFNQTPGNVKKQIVDKNTNKQYDYNVYVWNGDVQIVIDNKTYSLEEAINGNVITMDKIIEKANKDLPDTPSYDDGGSKVYKYDTYTIIKLHTLDGNRNIYIGNEKLSIYDVK